MRVYLRLTPITHTHTQRLRCSLIDLSLPQHWAGPMLTSSLDPQGFTKVKGQSGQIVPPVTICSALKTSPCLHYCFPINTAWPEEKVVCLIECGFLHVPISKFSYERLVRKKGQSVCTSFFCPFVEQLGIGARWREGSLPSSLFLPDRLKCCASNAEEEALRVCEVPLAVPSPTMSWLCGMWDMHSLLRVELNRARKALQAWETERKTKRENERYSKGRRKSLSTDYGI